jgi:hypothetical protein
MTSFLTQGKDLRIQNATFFYLMSGTRLNIELHDR